MPGLSNSTQATIAFKNLLNKSQTDNLKGLGNEAENIKFNIHADTIFVDPISSNTATAIAAGIAVFITADLTLDGSSNSHAYFATWPSTPPAGIDPITFAAYAYGVGTLIGITPGSRVKNAISFAYGDPYEAIPYFGPVSPANRIFVNDARNWVYQYQSGVFYQEVVVGPAPTLILLYAYTGQFLDTALGGGPNNAIPLTGTTLSNPVTGDIEVIDQTKIWINTSPATYIQWTLAGLEFWGDAIFHGNFSILGTETIIDTTVVHASDNLIILNYGGTHASGVGGGIIVEEGQAVGVDASLLIDASGTSWIIDPGTIIHSGFGPNGGRWRVSLDMNGGDKFMINDDGSGANNRYISINDQPGGTLELAFTESSSFNSNKLTFGTNVKLEHIHNNGGSPLTTDYKSTFYMDEPVLTGGQGTSWDFRDYLVNNTRFRFDMTGTAIGMYAQNNAITPVDSASLEVFNNAGNGYVLVTTPNQSAKYAADYSANYVLRSLIDKGYLDTRLGSTSTGFIPLNGTLLGQPVLGDIELNLGVSLYSGLPANSPAADYTLIQVHADGKGLLFEASDATSGFTGNIDINASTGKISMGFSPDLVITSTTQRVSLFAGIEDYASNIISINSNTRILYDASAVASLNWTSRNTKDSTNILSSDWQLRTLNDSTGVISANWGTRLLKDSASITSADWENRIANDSTGIQSIDWTNRLLQNSMGITANWDTSELWGSIISPSINPSLNWYTKQMWDDNGILSENWNSRILYDETGLNVLRWTGNTVHLFGANLTGTAMAGINLDVAGTVTLTTTGNITVNGGNIIDMQSGGVVDYSKGNFYADEFTAGVGFQIYGSPPQTKNGFFAWDDWSVMYYKGIGTVEAIADKVYFGQRFVSSFLKIDLLTDVTTFTSVDGAGIQYAADYSAGYTNRSLVDKGYVDGVVFGGNKYVYGPTAFTDGGTVTITHGFGTTDIVVEIIDTTAGEKVWGARVNNYTTNTVDVTVSYASNYKVIILR